MKKIRLLFICVFFSYVMPLQADQDLLNLLNLAIETNDIKNIVDFSESFVRVGG